MYKPWFPANSPTQPMPWLRGEPFSDVWGIHSLELRHHTMELSTEPDRAAPEIFGWQNQFENLNRMNLRIGIELENYDNISWYIYFILMITNIFPASVLRLAKSFRPCWLAVQWWWNPARREPHPITARQFLFRPLGALKIKVFAEFWHTLMMFDGTGQHKCPLKSLQVTPVVAYILTEAIHEASSPGCHPDVTGFIALIRRQEYLRVCTTWSWAMVRIVERRRLAKGQDLG